MSSKELKRTTIRNIAILIFSFLVAFVLVYFWVRMQQIPKVRLEQDEIEKLIDWQLQKQLRITVIILTIAIALIQFSRTTEKIKFPTLLLGIGLAIIQIVSVVRLIQNIRFVMQWERCLSPEMRSHISSIIAPYQVPLFFDEVGNFYLHGYVILVIMIGILVWIWITVLIDIYFK